jgi:hypothetical protein
MRINLLFAIGYFTLNLESYVSQPFAHNVYVYDGLGLVALVKVARPARATRCNLFTYTKPIKKPGDIYARPQVAIDTLLANVFISSII